MGLNFLLFNNKNLELTIIPRRPTVPRPHLKI